MNYKDILSILQHANEEANMLETTNKIAHAIFENQLENTDPNIRKKLIDQIDIAHKIIEEFMNKLEKVYYNVHDKDHELSAILMQYIYVNIMARIEEEYLTNIEIHLIDENDKKGKNK